MNEPKRAITRQQPDDQVAEYCRNIEHTEDRDADNRQHENDQNVIYHLCLV